MNNQPPFDPPFQAISAEFTKALLESAAAPAGNNRISSTKDGGAPGPVVSTKANVFFLVVPFAEKDEAKGLGARWDAAARKWYVPSGKDLEAFKRWLPKE